MFRTLVGKEIAETMLGLRFAIATLLCVVLIPLGMYVSRKDYEHRLASYQRELQTYRQRYGIPPPPLTGGEEAQGFRPPSVLSIFASGLDPFMPDKVFTSQSGLFRTVKESGIDNPQSLLFGKTDFLFNVMFIISLAALIFTFNSISGEREKGTLRLMIANSIPRSRILLSKIIGKYIVLLVPFMISVFIALLILDASPVVSISSPEVWPALLIILLATGLFILGMVSLGVCISAFTSHSMGSIVLLFFVWAMFIIGVPKMSPMIAESIYPVESGSVFSFRKRIVRDDIEKQFEQVKKETIDSKWDNERNVVQEMQLKATMELASRMEALGRKVSLEVVKEDPDFKELRKKFNQEYQELKDKYEPQVEHLFDECQRRIGSELNRIEQDYRNRRNIQFSIATNLARISPVSCYAYIVSGLSGTGVAEPDTFVRNARIFQEDINQIFYDKVFYVFGRQKKVTGFNVDDPLSFPDMRYRYSNLAEVLQMHWPDILLLCLFDMLFCALALVKFNRYDVR
jgi:ABC-type transport system involved in multi-copper enzyme maturation permease subunit